MIFFYQKLFTPEIFLCKNIFTSSFIEFIYLIQVLCKSSLHLKRDKFLIVYLEFLISFDEKSLIYISKIFLPSNPNLPFTLIFITFINIMRNSSVRLNVFITVYQRVIQYRFMCSLSTITSFSKTPPLDTMTFSLAELS